MQKNPASEGISVAESPRLGEVMIAGVSLREYLQAIALPSVLLVLLNSQYVQEQAERMNIFTGDPRYAAEAFVLLAVPAILFAVWKHERVWAQALACGILGLVGGFGLSVIRFVSLPKFHMFFNIVVETVTVGAAGVLAGIFIWVLAQIAKKSIPRLKGGVKQWRTQKHARA